MSGVANTVKYTVFISGMNGNLREPIEAYILFEFFEKLYLK